MRHKNFKYLMVLAVFFVLSAFWCGTVCAQMQDEGVTVEGDQAKEADGKDAFGKTGLPVPRFVSLAKKITNVRVGPSQDYPIKWVINRKSLPVEIIVEYYNWRKIRDQDGQEGWVFHTLLSGKRTAIIRGKTVVEVYKQPYDLDDKKPNISMYLEPEVQVDIDVCTGAWCRVSTSGLSGWIERKSLWGVYEHENID